MKGKAKGLQRVLNAAVYSAQGVRAAFRHEEAFRQEVYLALVMLPVAFIVELTQVERLLLVGSVVLVLIVELLNSGIEAVVDRVGTEYNELAGRAKDLGSAAVFLSLLLTGYIWVTILFLPG
ncbi:diacylglycerol kinase [Exilibacterium tricleocarpae]|uniref:Diacylglycerol kinase n=2 Tax=Exilibacterium tricleocarpae TaxID=2591008 RepID=A0A545TM22_9GAMM|nr:diacylglycerol kinase [Exilibacterium tricleocarpae]TQV78297.1 diacylglycerol kinase [Exilibacterium tricleocarpae]